MALRFVAPHLMSLVGAAFEQDPYAADGWHFRWFLSPELGLPRQPFELYLRPCHEPEKWHLHFRQPQVQPLPGALAQITTAGDALYDGCRLHYEPARAIAFAGGDGRPQLTPEPLYLDLRQRRGFSGPEAPSAGAALLEVILEPGQSVAVAAETYTADGYRVVDRAQAIYLMMGAPAGGPGPSGPIVALPGTAPGPVVALPTLTGGGAGTGVVAPSPGPKMFRLVVRGERIHRLRVQGAGQMELLAWLDTWDYVEFGGWDRLQTISLPVADPSGTWYRDPEWDQALDRAVERLLQARSRGRPPWDEEIIPPPPGAAGPEPWEYDERYLRPFELAIRPRLQRLLEESFALSIPQRELRESVALPPPTGPDGGTVTVGGSSQAEVPLLQMLFLEGMDYPMARLLGLGTLADLHVQGLWDFKLEATYRYDDLRNTPALLDLLDRAGETELIVVSVVSGLGRQRPSLPAGPLELRAERAGRATAADAVAHVRLDWAAPQVDSATAQARLPVLYAVRRDGPDGSAVLNPRDEASGQFKPLLPGWDEGRAVFFDLKLPREGQYTYRVSASDLWDRWSEWSSAGLSYQDDRLPLPPGNVKAAFIVAADKEFRRLVEESHPGEPAASQAVAEAVAWAQGKGQALRISFEWTEDHQAGSPAVQAFSVRVRRGSVVLDPQAGWRAIQEWPGIDGQTPPTPRNPVRVERLGSAAATLRSGGLAPGDVRLVAVEPFKRDLPQGGPLWGTRYVLDVAGFQLPAPGAARLRQYLSVGVVAHSDRNGRDYASPVSLPAVALLLYQDPPAPVKLPGLDWAAYPDATGRSQFELRWTGQAGIRYAVFRSDENALLEAALQPQEQPNLTGTPQEQARRLRELAARPKAQRAFQRLNDIPIPAAGQAEGALSYVDPLPGYAQVRFVYCLVGLSPTGVEGAWPSEENQFVVVHVPCYVVPAVPRWHSLEATDRGVRLTFNVEGARYDDRGTLPTDMPDGIEIYRCIDRQRVTHVRHMRYIGTLDKATVGEGTRQAVYLDATVRPWRQYYYRAVARGPAVERPLADGSSARQPAARSQASQPMTVIYCDPHPPSPATGLAIRVAGPDKRELTWSAPGPDDTPLGPFLMGVWRQRAGGGWEQVHLAPAAQLRQGAGYTYPLEAGVAGGAQAARYRVRIIDPLQRYADSEVLEG